MITLKIDNFAQAALENCRKPVKALDSKGG